MVDTNLIPLTPIDLLELESPGRVDGVPQYDMFAEEQQFKPIGLLAHEYVPKVTCMIRQMDNDLIYMTSYWQVERLWKVFLEKKTYERLLTRFLNGIVVYVDYGDDGRKFEVRVPKEPKIDGFKLMYNEVVQNLKSMNALELDEHMSSLDYDPRFGKW